MKGLTFPGSHDPRFCQFVIDRSRHLLKPVGLFKYLLCLIFLRFLSFFPPRSVDFYLYNYVPRRALREKMLPIAFERALK